METICHREFIVWCRGAGNRKPETLFPPSTPAPPPCIGFQCYLSPLRWHRTLRFTLSHAQHKARDRHEIDIYAVNYKELKTAAGNHRSSRSGVRLEAREGGPGLVGPNLENGAKVPLWPRAGHITP